MDEKLEDIIKAMVDNGESQDSIVAFIDRYKAENSTEVKEQKVVTEETTPTTEEALVTEDISLDVQPEWKPTVFTSNGELDTAHYEGLGMMEIEKQNYNTWKEDQYIKAEEDFNTPGKEIAFKKPSDIANKLENVDQIDLEIENEFKNIDISKVKNEKQFINDVELIRQDLILKDPVLKENIEETSKILNTELQKDVDEITSKFELDMNSVAMQLSEKYDLSDAKQVELANKELDEIRDKRLAKAQPELDRLNKEYQSYKSGALKRMQESPIFKNRFKLINDRINEKATPILRDVEIQSYGLFEKGGLLKYVDGTPLAQLVAGGLDIGKSFEAAKISLKTKGISQVNQQLAEAQNSSLGVRGVEDDKEIYVYANGAIDFEKSGIEAPMSLSQASPQGYAPVYNLKGELVTGKKDVYGGVAESELMKLGDWKKMQEERKNKVSSNIILNLEEIKSFDKALSLVPQPEFLDKDGATTMDVINTVFRMAPQLSLSMAGSALTVPTGGGSLIASTSIMFAQEYGSNYWEALQTGLREEIKEKEGVDREPTNEEVVDALLNDKFQDRGTAAGYAAVSSLLEQGTGIRGVKALKGTRQSLLNFSKKLGYKNIKDMLIKTGKNNFNDMLRDGGQLLIRSGRGGVEEFFVEGTQTLLNQAAVSQAVGGTAIDRIDPKNALESAIGGGVTGIFLPGVGGLVRGGSKFIKQTAYKASIGKVEADKFDKFFKNAAISLQDLYDSGKITQEQYQQQSQEVANLRNTATKIPKSFGPQARQKSLDLMLERQKLQAKIKAEDEAFTGPSRKRIKEINEELSSIQAVEVSTKQVVKAVKKSGLDIEVIELENEAAVEEFIKEKTDVSSSKAKEAGKQRGFILPDGKTIVINKNVAVKEKAVTTTGHEVFHAILFNTINKGDENAFALANAIKMQLSNISTEDFKNSDLAARIEQYKADPNINEATKAEEVLTLFSEAIATGDIKFEEGVFTKLKDFVRRILQNAGFSNIDFNDSKDVYNFIKDYNKSISKGKFTKAQVKAAKEGVVVSETLKDRVKDVAEKGVDETILKFSKTEVTELAKQYKKDPNKTDVEELIKQYDNVALKALGYDISKGTIAPEEAISFVNKEFDSILRRYDGSTEFSTWINSNIRPKRQAFYEEQIGKESETTSIDSEQARQVVDDSSETTDDRTEKEIRQSERKTKVAKRLKLEDKAIKEVASKIENIDLSKVNYKTLKNLANETIGEAFGISPKKILSNANLTKSEIANAQRYIKNNVDLLKALLPDGYNKDFKSTGVPKVLLDKFYNKRSVRSKTGAGLNVQIKKPTIGSTEFLEVFGFIEGKPTRDDRNISARIIALANQTGKAITNQTVREQLQKDGMPESALQDIKSGTPVGMFSLSTKPIQEKLNELAISRDKNKIAKVLGFKSEAINELNREELQALMQDAVEKGYIDKAVIEAGAMASAGKQTFYGNKNKKYPSVAAAKKAGLKLPLKYVKTTDGNYVLFAKPKKGLKEVSTSNDFKRQDIPTALQLPKGVSYVADPGRLYYGKDDLAYVKLLENAKDSPFDENGYRQIGISAKGEFIGREALISKIDKKVKGTNKTQSEINMDMLDHVVNQLSKAVDNGMSMDVAGMIIIQSYQATGGLIKTAAPFEGISDVFEAGKKMEIRSKKLYREEHNPPASVVGANLLWAIKNNAAKAMMKEVRKNFSQTILSKKDDSKLDIDYAATMPIGTNMSSNPIIRMAMAGINLNTVSDLRTGQTYADKFGLGVDNKFKNIDNVAAQQNKLIKQVVLEGLDIKEAKKQLDQYLKIAPSQLKASKSTNTTLKNSKVLDVEGDLNIEDLLSKAASIDEALNIARDINSNVKKIRVFDFDDTLATTKSDVLFTAPDGTEGRLNAEEFATKGKELLDEGYVFDFSDFNKVTKGKPGPLLNLAKKIQEARGTEDVFVLTARAPEAQSAIKEFLDSVGLNIPLKNITGLGNSTGEAKANWMVDKAAEGYNDFYFADDAYQNVKAVKDVMSVIDVKSKVQQAKFSLSEDLNSDFNKILENKSGIGAEKVYSSARAKTVGANKGKFKFFIPASAEDFVGLLYPTLAKGKLGDEQMAWYKERLLNPFARAAENLSKDRVNLMQDFKALKKELEVPKDLRKEAVDGFTNEQAVRVYLWNKQGLEVPGLSKRDLKDLSEAIDKNPKLKVFADQLQAINKSDGYPEPGDTWLVGTITTDLIDGLNTTKRVKYLEEWQTNADIIFSKENLNKMEAIYGAKYREAMENILSRMKTGINRPAGGTRIGNQILDYINGSVGAIMFFNTRSAVLQTISAINFINVSGDNNILAAGKAFANQPQYWKDFTELINSPFLKDRRNGLKLNISESEIADAAATSKNKSKAALNYILQKGFLPTQFADSFAIASGGATFYRNKINSLIKDGMSEGDAKEQAYKEFREIAEESQQSSRPDKISQQQASNVGRVILAFANTPSQYARIIKKAAVDLKNGRGDWKNNISKIIYYGAMQNLIFNVLQQALFAVGFGDEEEDDEQMNKRYTRIGNGMIDSLLRGLGYGGAAVSVAKNLLLDVYERSNRKRPEYVDSAWKLLQFSPPVSSKVSKLKQAGYMVDKYSDEMINKGFAIDNPAYEAAAKVVTATTNVPLDRLFNKANNISAAMDEDAETWQSVAMMLGWSEWQIKPKQKKKKKKKKSGFKEIF